jgi:hypothetical protein
MDDFFTGVCFDTSKEGEGGIAKAPIPLCEDQRRLAYAASGRGKAKGRSQVD